MAENEKKSANFHWIKTSAEQHLEERSILNITTTLAATNTEPGSEDIELAATSSVIHRVTASPRQVKTQIAKLSYAPVRTNIKPLTTQVQKVPSKTPAETAQALDTSILIQEEFNKKKDERDKEIQEIQNMLNEITKTPEKVKPKLETETTRNIPKNKPPSAMNHSMSFRRSKTEVNLNLERPKAATTRRNVSRTEPTTQPRSRSSQPPPTKSSELLPPDSCSNKKKSYDPAEARRFMEEQKKKRRSNPSAGSQLHPSKDKTALEKEQIKQRLAELRKNTRQILSKNVKKKRTESSHNTIDMQSTRADGLSPIKVATPNAGKIVFKQPVERKNLNRNTAFEDDLILSMEVGHSIGNVLAQKPQQEQPPQFAISDRTQISNSACKSALLENQKRIGLLRKPELKDHSFSAIKEFSFDKENVALEMMTPKITTNLEPRIKEKLPSSREEIKDSVEEQKSGRVENHTLCVVKELQLEKPSARLKTHNSVLEKAVQVQETSSLMGIAKETRKAPHIAKDSLSEGKQPTDLPYWLKPSAVQIYPYNFIMAVRRKLDSIANPPFHPQAIPTTSSKNKNQSTSTGDSRSKKVHETPLTSVPKDRVAEAQQNVKRRIIEDCFEESAEESLPLAINESKSAAKLKVQDSHESLHKSQTLSDVNSNFSSISIRLPISNTVSEVSSLKSECIIYTQPKTISKSRAAATISTSKSSATEDDDTTASSSIFNSPEKKVKLRPQIKPQDDYVFAAPRPVSPLSLERIENLKITSKTKLKAAMAFKHITTERGDILPDQNQKSQQIEPQQEAPTTTDVSINFNQLLDDFNRSLSQVIQVNEQLKSTLDKSHQIFSPRGGRNRSTDEYTTDFEESSRKDSFQQVEVVKQRTDAMQNSLKQRKRNLFEITNVVKPLLTSPPRQSSDDSATPQLHLNLDSVESSNSTESKTQSLKNEDEPTPQEFEKRLQVVEQLKADLRQSILNSKANRTESDNSDKTPHYEGESNSAGEHSKNSNPWKAQKYLQQSAIETIASDQSPQIESLTLNSSLANNKSPPMNSEQNSSISPGHSNNSNANSPKEIKDHALSNSTQKSTEYCSKSITEDLQNEFVSPSKDNDNGNHKNTKYLPSTHNTAQKSHTHEEVAFIKSHINNSRGDFLPDLDENAVSNETHFQMAQSTAVDDSSSASIAPPGYREVEPFVTKAEKNNEFPIKSFKSSTKTHSTQAIGSEIAAIFNQSDMELSIASSHHNASLSESSLNYSSVGLYEKLIQNETTKSEHLTALLKMREKALLDRTKGQIAWLEVQKERYRAKGLIVQIAAIKKKQRGILLKMEKEREEIKRLLQSTTTTTTTSAQSSSRLLQAAPQTPSKRKRHHTQSLHSPQKQQPPAFLLPPQIPVPKSTRSHTQSKQHKISPAATRSAPIVRANYDLESSRPLEELLQRREADLRRRREHVELLMKWHQRLDQEEAEVLQLERMVYNNAHAAPPTPADLKTPNGQSHNPEKFSPHRQRSTKMERRLKEIDKSLRELSSISSSNSTMSTNAAGTSHTNDESAIGSVDFVRTTGIKLNKLWRRLTSQQIEKFEPNRRYKLCKPDLERLYEEAKIAVLRDFALDEERITAELLEKSASSSHRSSPVPQRTTQPASAAGATLNRVEVPSLNLNFSSGQSEQEEEESVAAASINSLPQGNYSPSAAEEDFNMRTSSSGSKSNSSLASESELNVNAPTPATPSKSLKSVNSTERSQQIERNKLRFLELTQQRDTQNGSTTGLLQRSLSDTKINEMTLQNDTHQAANVAALSQFIVVSHSRTRSSPISSEGVNQPSASDTLKSLQSLQSLTTPSSQQSSSSIEVASNASVQQSSASSLSKSTISGSATFKNTENSPNSSGESLRSLSMALAKQISSESNKEMLQSRQNSVICSIGQTSDHSAKTASSMPTQAHTNMSTFSGQFSSIDSDSKAREISAKLEQISVAVTQLSQSNSLLPTYQSITARNDLNAPAPTPPTTSIINDESNQSTEDASYSCHFENISTDMNSPSGCTLKGSSSTNSANIISATHVHPNQSSKAEEEPPVSEDSSTKSSNDTSSRLQSIQSKTFICEPNPLSQTSIEEKILDAYEADFESTSDETRLDDITLPQFDSTVETTQEEEDDKSPAEEETLETKASLPPPPPPPPPPSSTTQTSASNNEAGGNHLMPDIINELEIRRVQQILLETEQLKQFEHVTAVPYMYVREIPNKPPPPYVPPAHGSPMTTIFPSADRIEDITFRRTHELYCEISKTDYNNEKGEKLPSVMEEKITNIYERIILDICREHLINMSPNPPKDPLNFHSQLAFFNPPDRLRCIQASIYKEVRRCLGMDKTPPKRTQVYSVYGQRARRDHIGKIIIQEMYDEDDKWCNFHREENEVLELILEEMIVNDVRKLAREELVAEGGTVDLEDATTDEWEEETSNVEEVVEKDAEKTPTPEPEMTAESSSNSVAKVEPMASSINDTASN